MNKEELEGLRDIQLDGNWQLTPAASGDLLLLSGSGCLMQEIRMEAQTQEGDLFYDEGFGWSLLDFVQTEDSELQRLEIKQRITEKLAWYEEIETGSIMVEQTDQDGLTEIKVHFRLIDEGQRELAIALNRIAAEVVIADG